MPITPARSGTNSPPAVDPTPAQETSRANSWSGQAPDAPESSVRRASITFLEPRADQKRLIAEARYATDKNTAPLSSMLVEPAELPAIIDMATRWTREMEKMALQQGEALTPDQQKIAMDMGVKFPQKIRLVNNLITPIEPKLRDMMLNLGMLQNVTGKAFGYGVFISEVSKDDRALLSHEFRHVKQFEDFGSIRNFVTTYVEQLNKYGYRNSGIEQDAYRHQLEAADEG